MPLSDRRPSRRSTDDLPHSGWFRDATRWLRQSSGVLAAMLVLLAGALPAPMAWAQAVDITITQAQVARGDTPAFPEQAALRNVALPDLWERANHEEGPSWYRLQFSVANPEVGPLLGAYVDRACARVELRLNNQLLHVDAGPRGAAAVRGCHVGLLVPLPASLLRAGANQIDIRLEGQPLERVAVRERAALLGPVQIAPLTDLADQAQTQRDINASLAIALTT
ncbi:MAG: hypothetical protein RL375_3377, partial [Pseudomonadota bacterium]